MKQMRFHSSDKAMVKAILQGDNSKIQTEEKTV